VNTTSRRLTVSLVLTLAFVFVEASAGWMSNSLALLTDAAHNLTDVLALALTWYALRLMARPPTSHRTFGYHRAGILAALFNSTTLVVVALVIFYEAYQRLMAPPPVQENIMIVVAALAFVVNAGTAWMIHRGSENDLNMRSAFVHLAGDAVSTLGAFVAGIGIALTGWQILDPLVSILIGALILWNAWGIVRETVDILLESTPRDVDIGAMVDDITRVPGVRGVHDLHVWSLSSSLRMLSAHVLTQDMTLAEGAQVQHDINQLLLNDYGIGHTALQLECNGCEPDVLYCELVPAQNRTCCSDHES
jgi:cobalt-zinc-cadmium efflux system protein